MFCTACATLNLASARACMGCGAGLAGSPPDASWGAEAKPPAAVSGGASRGRARRGHRRLTRILYLVPLVALVTAATVGLDRYRDDRAALAAAYDRGLAAEAAGRLNEAITHYGLASGYRDADDRRDAAVAALVPYRSAYLEGVSALDAGRFDDAIALLIPVVRDLPGYEDAATRLHDARERRRTALEAEAEAAQERGDWLAAETALATLQAENPDDPALGAQLAALRVDHAPLVLTREHRLVLVGPNLDNERLVTEEVPASWPSWSPDRTRIAFISPELGTAGDDRLFVVNVDGTGLRLLANRVQFGSYWPMWSPDGTRIAYTSQEGYEGPNGRGLYSVHVVDLATGEDRNVTEDLLNFAAWPTWSPDGDRIAFAGIADRTQPSSTMTGRAGVELYVLDLAEGKLTGVGQGRLPNTDYLAWSPTDDQLLVYGFRQRTYRSPETFSIHRLDLDTGEIATIHEGSQPVAPPVWSPDGDRFAYVEGDMKIHVRWSLGRPGEASVNLPGPVLGFLTWSPDAAALLAAAFNPEEPSYVIPLAKGLLEDEQPLVLAYDELMPNAGPPMWSPVRPAPITGPPSVEGTARDAQ